MSDFEKYWEENASKESWANKAVAAKIWSDKQSKIDELQKRIDELEWFAKSIRNWDAHPKDLEINNGSWGVRDFYRNYADNVLKGEPNDN